MLSFDVHVKGIAPILFARFPEEDFQSSENLGRGTRKPNAQPTREEQTEKSLYRVKLNALGNNKHDVGKLYTPADHIVGSMVKAGAKFKLSGRTTFKEAVSAGVFVEPLEVIHINQGYESDWRSAVNKSTKGRIMTGRGRINDWELKFKLVCIDDRVSAGDLESILRYAGNYCGIGAYRPRYGRFEVLSFVPVKS